MTFFGLALLVALAGQGSFEVHLPEHPGDPVVVSGIQNTERFENAASLSDYLAVFVAGESDIPAMLGNVSWEQGRLSFSPRFAFRPGQAYEAVYKDAQGKIHRIPFQLRRNRGVKHPVAQRIYPTADLLPQNLLRFYVYFSEPMRVGKTFTKFKLLTSDGLEVDQAFVETVPELWSEDDKRITLIVHPGRVKRGLEMGQRYGSVLEVGKSYTVMVEQGVPSASGTRTENVLKKEFTVVEADHQSPKPKTWEFVAPAVGTNHALRIDMHETLDHALLARHLTVLGPGEKAVPGTLTVSLAERTCFFQPDLKWERGTHYLKVGAQLEDLAGNQLHMLFDRAATPQKEERRPELIPFETKSKPH